MDKKEKEIKKLKKENKRLKAKMADGDGVYRRQPTAYEEYGGSRRMREWGLF